MLHGHIAALTLFASRSLYADLRRDPYPLRSLCSSIMVHLSHRKDCARTCINGFRCYRPQPGGALIIIIIITIIITIIILRILYRTCFHTDSKYHSYNVKLVCLSIFAILSMLTHFILHLLV